MPQIDLISLRYGQQSNWEATNPILYPGEPGVEIETGRMKVGNGTTPWNDLPYTAGKGDAGPAGPVSIEVGPVAPAAVYGDDILWADTTEAGDGIYPGPMGPPGPTGAPGPVGAGVPAGGTTGQGIVKTSDNSTQWRTPWQVDVRDYGPVDLTGVVDCSATIQAADSAVAPGYTIWFPPGRYLIASTITKSPFTIWRGLGNNPYNTSIAGTNFRYTGEGTCVVIAPVAQTNNCRGQIVGIRFNYAGGLGAATTSVAIQVDRVTDQIIENCYILAFDVGVDGLANCSAVYVQRCWIGSGRIGVRHTNNSDNWLIHTQAAGREYGLWAYASSSLQIADSRIQGSGLANAYLERCQYFGMTGGLSDSATLATSGTTRYGLVLKDCQNSHVTGVAFYSNGTDHILIENTGTDFTGVMGITISGNVFHGNGVRIVLTSGAAKWITITGNECNSSLYYLAKIDKPVAGTLTGLVVVGNVGAGVGILGTQYVTDLTMSGNQGLPGVTDGVMLVDGATICDTPWVQLPGASGDGVALVGSPPVPAGDRCIVARVAPATWTPAGTQTFVSSYHSTGNQRAWSLSLLTSGVLRWTWTTDGTSGTVVNKDSTANLSALAPYAWKWVAATHDVDNGASGNDVRFWTSDDGTTWTQLGATVTTAGVATVVVGTSDIWLSGIISATSQQFVGRVSNASVRSGMGAAGVVGGTELAAFSSVLGTNTYLDANGNQWTLKGNARFFGAMSSAVNRPTGVSAAVAMQNLGLGTALAASWLMWTGTQAAYDAIVTKDPNTLYVVT